MKKSTRNVERSLIAVSYAYDLLHVMEERGASSEAIIRSSGIPAALFKGHDARLSTGQFAALVNACRAHGDVEGLGYAFGLSVKPPSHGLLGLAALNCRTPREAAELATRFSPLRSGMLRLQLVEEGDVAALHIESSDTLPQLQEFFHESTLAVLLRFVQLLLGSDQVGEVWFRHEEPPHHRAWRHRLPPTRFGMPATALRLPRLLLDLPLPQANPLSTRAAVSQMEAQLRLVEAPAGTACQVRRLLLAAREGMPGLRDVAALLNISPSTLKRRLQLEGTTFQQQLDEVRRSRAMELLRLPTLTIEQVGRHLGYSDSANFTRGFRKWTGRSPSEWRREPG